MISDKLTHLAESALGRVRVSNALNACLWLCGLIVPSGLIALPFLAGGVQVTILVLIFIPVTLFAFAYIYLMIKDPSKLRSEDYELRRQALEVIQEKGTKSPLLTAAVEAIACPDAKRLKQSDKEIASK